MPRGIGRGNLPAGRRTELPPPHGGGASTSGPPTVCGVATKESTAPVRTSRFRAPVTPVTLELVLSACLVVLVLAETAATQPPTAPWATALGVLTVLPAAYHRRHPLATTVGLCAAVLAWTFLVTPTPPFAAFLATMLCAWAAGRCGRPAVLITVLGLLAVTLAVVGWGEGGSGLFEAFIPVTYIGGASVLGVAMRVRHERFSALSRRAQTMERARDQENRLAAAEERARIAREVHDIVAHSLGVMVVHAEAAEEVLTNDPPAAARSLQLVQTTGRQSVSELRRLLDLLREPAAGGTVDDGSLEAPSPAFELLPALVDQMATAEVHTRFAVEGEPFPLGAGAGVTVYRVAQEALTNAVRHSGARRVDVTLSYLGSGVELRVHDDGRAPSAPTAGHGLTGMRERVSLFRGDLAVGPDPAGGFTVRVHLPRDEVRA
jgi:signal transduction histidine kinase